MDNTGVDSNTSGCGSGTAVPAEVKRWNWGAFFLTWIWGVGNNTYIAFLAFVPFLGLAMPFVLGAKGSEWAWKNRNWPGVAQFRKTQRRWAWAGLATVIFLIIGFAALAATFLATFHDNGAYRSSVAAIKDNREVQAVLGTPIKAGWLVLGQIYYDENGGRARLSYSLSGRRGSGKAYVYAVYMNHQWILEQVVVAIPDSTLRIHVIVDGHKPHSRGPV